MTRKEIAYNILNTLRGGRSTNNDHISLRQVMFNVDHYRAMLLRRDFEKNGKITRHHEQDLGCIEITPVNASKCCGLPLECVVHRSVIKLPRMIRYNYRDGITHISDPTGLNTIPLVDANTVQFLPYDRFTKNERKAYTIEDWLYIYNANGIDHVNVRGVLESPAEAALFDCDGSDCYNEHSQYPLSADLVTAITEGLLKGTFMLLPATAQDTVNDNIEDTALAPPVQNGKG